MWGSGATEDVIVVPQERKNTFLDEAQAPHIRIQSGDGSTWMKPAQDDVALLMRFLSEFNDRRSWSPHEGTRYGCDDAGVFIHRDHLKRYFGILREFASAVLRHVVPQAVAKQVTTRKGARSSERLMGGLLANVGAISDNVREDVLKAAFRGVDKDRSGVLEKNEMVTLIRRVMPTMSGHQVVELMETADTNKNNVVDYDEFVTWLKKSAPKDIQSRLTQELETEYDCVRAVFRLWDRNGDGLITKKELASVLKKTCPDMTLSQVDTLCLHLDRNKDGKIDYDEFLDFLFCE